jgi:sugar/nucleoside kinase (ribokinase family)
MTERDAHTVDLDVVGIGALNLDYIASAVSVPGGADTPSITDRLARLLVQATGSFQPGVEMSVDEQTIYAALEEVSTVSLDATLGGSCFNAVYTLTQLELGLRLGFVGVAGRIPVPGLSSVTQFDRLGVDRRYVLAADNQSCGICFSFNEGSMRTLITHAGANAQAAGFIRAEFDNLVEYLSRARVVHATSFLDPTTPEEVRNLLATVKQTNPKVLISFDPGHEWCVNPTPAIEGITRLSDFLLLNQAEFNALGRSAAGEDDIAVAGRVLDLCATPNAVVIVKRSDCVLSFQSDGPSVSAERYAQDPLPDAEIADSTGAGDVFAAGLLAAVAGQRMQVELGCLLGMRLARHKLKYVGVQGHPQLAEITKNLLREGETERRRASLARGVFVAHGRDPAWYQIKEFIEQECELRVYAFETESWESRNITEALSGYLDRCSFAVCVLTGEDMTEDGRRRARQNVIHEAGLFQGRYGFDRVLLLVDEECDFHLDPIGLNVVTFPRRDLASAFWQISRMIRQQGFVRPGQLPAPPAHSTPEVRSS